MCPGRPTPMIDGMAPLFDLPARRRPAPAHPRHPALDAITAAVPRMFRAARAAVAPLHDRPTTRAGGPGTAPRCLR